MRLAAKVVGQAALIVEQAHLRAADVAHVQPLAALQEAHENKVEQSRTN
jgi:hypothetical protein